MVLSPKTNPKDENQSQNSALIIKHKTHDDQEIEIQTDRVLSVLDETIWKIKIAALLGYLSENNGEILQDYLTIQEVNFILGTCDLYLEALPAESENRSFISTTDTTSAKFHERSLLMKEKYDVNLMRSVDVIYSNSDLVDYIKNLDVQLDNVSSNLIQAMVELKLAAKVKLSTSASEERDKEKELKNAWKDNLETKSLIEGLQERLNKQNDDLNIQLEAKDNLIKMYMEKIEEVKMRFKEDIKKRVTNSEKEMVKQYQISEEKQQILSQQAKDSTQSYNQLLEQHLAAEKILRGKRFKVEAQLGSWLEKYDKEIGDRQAELEELQGQYDAEKAEMDALQAKIDEQEEEYLELMSEKKEYEDGIFNKRYFEFIMNRAARRIQRCWRAYKERKKARRKAKQKKKKGKVSEEEVKPPEPEIVVEDVENEMFGDVEDDEPPLPDGEEEIVIGDKGKKGKGKGKCEKKGKKKEKKSESTVISRDQDPMEALSKSKLAGHVFEDISEEPIPSGPGNVDLNA